jgi:hypothetical protein
MPFKEEAFGFFIDITFNQDIVFIFLCNIWQFIYFRSTYFLVLFRGAISERIFDRFLKEIDLEKIILTFLDILFDFLNHLNVCLIILLKRNKFMSINR